MKIHRQVENLNIRKPVVTVGTFDGVHRGHMMVIEALKNEAKNAGGESVLFTFWPHPRHVVGDNREIIPLLTTIEERLLLFEKTGIDHLVIYPFTREFSMMSSRSFIERVLIDKLQVARLVTGYDHQFGKDREGNIKLLKEYESRGDFSVFRIDPENIENITVSSTRIRRALEDGDLETARLYLGYDYNLTGKVAAGDKLGRKLGFPTANIDLDHNLKHIPRTGVYAVEVMVKGKIYGGMLNIGFRPTVSTNYKNRQIEVHLFDFNQSIYDAQITVYFIKRMRDEIRFASLDELKIQLESDRNNAGNVLNTKKKSGHSEE